MECAAKQAASARVLQALCRSRRSQYHHPSIGSIHPQHLSAHRQPSASSLPRRHASTSSGSPPQPKKIVLEQPDKFRPPSHASKRNARSTTAMYGGGAAYNQGMSAAERAKSRQKSYPHMFPNEGTTMHWFLTTRWVHVTITMAVLLTLAFTSLVSTWSQTSPYAHLIPPLNMLFFSPFTYLSEIWSVYRLHLEYNTAQTAEHRRQNILDAQKRRLYRRAHGMEDLTADEVSGPDVKGLVEWDDGLTNRERERGGVYRSEMMGVQMQEMGQRPGESYAELMERKRGEQTQMAQRREEDRVKKAEEAARAEEERLVRIGARRPEDQQERPRRKVWLGIWG